jgi:CIC family chloride channel protein
MSDQGVASQLKVMPGGEADKTLAGPGRLLVLGALSLLVGAASGLVGACFRLSLEQADRFRNALISWSYGWHVMGLLLVMILCASASAVAAWLVRRYSIHASGSGIPHVEAVLVGELPPAPIQLVPVKFLGGVLAIGSGLALGREGPSVQMGASVSHFIGVLFRRDWADGRVLLAAGAGAGLATAFNAPIAGAVFVLEELVRCFETRIALGALAASATAIAVGRLILGHAPDFLVEPLPYAGARTLPLYLTLGVMAGILGVAYNWTLLGALAASDRLGRSPVEMRAGAVGALVGLVAWLAPSLVGGGDVLTQRTLAGGDALGTLVLVFGLRFVLGALSYAAATPGGLFAPMLVLGAQAGSVFGIIFTRMLPAGVAHPPTCAVVGMAAFFTAVVRAPLTGIILVTEMTASFTLLLPMLGACFTAMLVPTVLGNAPIYDSLRRRV